MVSDYAKLFATKPLNGNPGMWEWGMTKILGRPRQEVMCWTRVDTYSSNIIVLIVLIVLLIIVLGMYCGERESWMP